MHPAGSLIGFTTLSGAGFGLLAFLALGMPEVTGGLAFFFWALGFVLAAGGLSLSLLHLGRPERALRAFTQWRSSWLSREAWAAVVALGLLGLTALFAIFGAGAPAALGVPAAALAAVTVGCTSMIYAQLRTVPRWHSWTTPALFLAFAATGGALLSGQVAGATILLVLLGAVQIAAWALGDGRFAASGSDTGTATGLGGLGAVRLFEPPHTGGNYLTREMVHVVGRRHARKLRAIGFFLAVILPLGALVLLPAGHIAAGLAVISHLSGAFVCRWLFFAEAEHVVGLYYGRD